MNADQLRQLQAPFKERYKQDPGAALIRLRAQGVIGEGIACRVDTGKASVEAGLHPSGEVMAAGARSPGGVTAEERILAPLVR